MPRHEGIVTCVSEDGSAHVYIQPGDSAIPGAPDVNVCHCTTESSNILIEAVNIAGASSGDRVSVYRKASVLIKNAIALIATPLAGILVGIWLGMELNGGLWKASAAATGTAAGLLTGIMIYRRFSPENQTVITHILQKGAIDMSVGDIPGCGRPTNGAAKAACDGCSLYNA